MRKNKAVFCFFIMAILMALPFSTLMAQDELNLDNKSVDQLLTMSDEDFFKIFINQLIQQNNEEIKKLMVQYYNVTNDADIKMYILSQTGRILQGSANDNLMAAVYALLIQGINEGVGNPDVFKTYQAEANWRVRVAGAMMLGEVAHIFPEDKFPLRKTLKALLWVMQFDPDERVRGTAALSMGKILKKISGSAPGSGTAGQGGETSTDGQNPMLEDQKSGKFYIERMIMRLEKLPLTEHFQAACICRALGEIGNPIAFIPLMEARHRGFNQMVQQQIVIALARIAGSPPSGQ